MRVVSLSHVNDPATTSLYPGDPPFTLTRVDGDGWYLQVVHQGEHTGTHWGAPAHFTPGAATADRLDVQDLLRPVVRVDARAQCAADPDYALTVDDLRAFEHRHGRIPDGAVVVMWTGWDTRWGTPAFANLDERGVPRQPGFGVAAVRWLLDTGRLGRVGGTGTDTFGPDRGTDPDFAVSRLVYREHRVSLECLANLAALPPAGAQVFCGGTLNRGGSGSTALVVALLPD